MQLSPKSGESPSMAPPPPELNPDAVSEILLRLPPDDPAGLVRASAVCKPWLRTLSDPAFIRRYRAFHGTPPVLGFLHNLPDPSLARFLPTTGFRQHAAAAAAHRSCAVLDCRHGRALLYDYRSSEFIVWDPISGHERRIPDEDEVVAPGAYYTNHAVLCAAAGAGCDHSTCSRGPFLLASAGVHGGPLFESNAYACLYSSESGARSAHTHHRRLEDDHCSLDDSPASFVGGALYFAAGDSGDLLRYDVLGEHGLSLVELPPANLRGTSTVVMTAGNGGLGLATFDNGDGMLALWSTDQTGTNRAARWVHTKLINLQRLLPVDIRMSAAWLSGFAEDANVIFLSTDDNGTFTIELKSLLTRKVCEMRNVNHVFPYVSFYTPAGGFKLPDNDSSTEKSQCWESGDNARSSKPSMHQPLCAMDNEQWYGKEEKAGDEPPTKRQKRGASSNNEKSAYARGALPPPSKTQ